jgi:ABC-type Fe3+/spermidine/putrescine transport system ATPase subunit
MTLVDINGLTKRYGRAVAVNDLSLAIGDGEFVSLLGPSGCGKTTTLRCIAGFVSADAGSIAFDSVDIGGFPPERRNIGMVFQNYALFPHLTVYDNLNFGLAMRRVTKAAARDRISRILETVQLAGFEDRYPRQLSGGQQQRVALARALVIEPSVLLLDEPLANIDAKLRDEMRFFIRALHKRVGITTVYVTHDQAEAMTMSDRVVVMFGGEIKQIGSPTEIYARPLTRQVAEFIGLSNFIVGRVRAAGADGVHVIETPLEELCCSYGGRLAAGEPVTIMVRPEVIALAREAPAHGQNCIAGVVRERHFLGNICQVKVACANGAVIQVEEEPWLDFAIGDRVWCSFAPERAWLIREAEQS